MYYRLKPGYILRGWEEMSWVLVKRPANEVRLLTQGMFHVLLLCDGETKLPGGLLDSSMEGVLEQCKNEGLVEPSQKPHPLEPDQYYQYYHNRYTRRVFWSITGRCNFRCRHCYMDAPDDMLGELSTEEALSFIDQMADCGVLRVDLTGGEPLVRKDLWQLIDRILSHKMVIGQFYTNGWLLDNDVLDEFQQRGLKPEISVSFDGVGWHDWMRQIPGSEKAALGALKLCHDRGFPTSVGMCIHRGNLHTIPQTIDALKNAGVTEVKTANVDETGLWRLHSQGNALTRQEYIEGLLPYIDWYYKAGRPIRSLEFGGIARLSQEAPGEVCIKRYDGTENCLDCYLCSPARWSCYVTPEGRLLPCMPMTASLKQEYFPKIQEIGLRQGLKDSYYMQFVNSRVKDLFAENEECAACQYRFQCGGGCRAAALLEGDHSLMGCDRDMCMLWKSGYAERIGNAVDEANGKYSVGEENL